MAGPRPKNLAPRRDPVRRRGFAGFDQTRILNADPARKYKLVDPADRMNGVTQHEHHGWIIEKKSRDGAALQMGSTAKNAGDPHQLYDHVLMSIDRAEWERIEREGQYGERGQEMLDDIDAQITDPHGGSPDGGITSRYAAVVNETKPTESYVTSTQA